MPIYSMNVYKLTKEFCKEISSVLAQFWWSRGNGDPGLHWFAWNRLALPKREGGLGFRDLKSFNQALLGKQTWRLLKHPNSLLAKLLKGRYYHDLNILNARQGRKASFIWKSILHGRDLVKKGLRFCIGDGSLVDAWVDPYLPTYPPRPPLQSDNAPQQVLVQHMMNQSRTGWDVAKIQEWIDPQDVETILNITLCSTAHQDLIGWHYTRHGFYTVKSGYWLATHAQEGEQVLPPPGNVELKQAHWKIKTAPKIKHFFWCLLSNALPTGATLKYRHITNDSTCVRCCRMQRNGKTQKIIFRSLQRFPQAITP
ncbi:putative reverse transcriptase zinc-binding domain-containing protein [Arabidopsis thaliana]